jgi:hypothetical protein
MYKNLTILFILLFLLQSFIAVLVLYTLGKNEIEKDLKNKIARAQEDLTYTNGKWNIDRYNSDPQLLGSYPLYIITTDGFILDRRNPIKGFLDSANFDDLLAYDTPQTLTTITGNTRRVFSKTITDNKNSVIALVAVSYLEPQEQTLATIDTDLVKTVDHIISKIQINTNSIDTSRVDEREIPYAISFLIVDKYNSTLLKSTNVNNRKRIPSFIDPSYVKQSLDNTGLQTVRDTETNEQFLVITEPIIKNNQTLGVISVGAPMKNILTIIKDFALWFGVFTIALLSLFGFVLGKMLRHKLMLSNQTTNPSSIRFDSKQSLLLIDNNSLEVAYASNQYYLLRTLFSNPQKRFETDELLEEFGEINTKTDSRKVYDTMTNINKKVAGYIREKLIINQNKTYQLNPQLPIEKTKK